MTAADPAERGVHERNIRKREGSQHYSTLYTCPATTTTTPCVEETQRDRVVHPITLATPSGPIPTTYAIPDGPELGQALLPHITPWFGVESHTHHHPPPPTPLANHMQIDSNREKEGSMEYSWIISGHKSLRESLVQSVCGV